MKSILVAALALACVLGLATAQYGYHPSAGAAGGQSGKKNNLINFYLDIDMQYYIITKQ